MSLLFDTLKLSKNLREKGEFTPAQADALAEGIASASIDNLATKDDIKVLETRLDLMATKNDLKDLRIATKDDIHDLQASVHELENKMYRLMFGSVGLIIAATGIINWLHK